MQTPASSDKEFSDNFSDLDEKVKRVLNGINGAVKVKRLPTHEGEADDNVSNKEVKGDSGEFDG